MTLQETLTIQTHQRGTLDITDSIKNIIAKATIKTGLCNLFLHHTSASIILCENYDPTVREDLEAFMQRLIPDGDKLFKHTLEGPDDMPAHIRTILTQNSLVIPITENKLNLGQWQGVFLWEHRTQGHLRKLTVTLSI